MGACSFLLLAAAAALGVALSWHLLVPGAPRVLEASDVASAASDVAGAAWAWLAAWAPPVAAGCFGLSLGLYMAHVCLNSLVYGPQVRACVRACVGPLDVIRGRGGG